MTKHGTTADNWNSLSLEDTIKAINIWSTYNNELKQFTVRFRNQNMPQEMSESLAIWIARLHPSYKYLRWSKGHGSLSGDAHIPATSVTPLKKIEIKCFTSNGPVSFGPKERWDTILFVDARSYKSYHYSLYEITLNNDSPEFRALKVSKTQTYGDQCSQGRRPRLSFSQIQSQIGQDHCKLLWSGDIRDLLTK